MTIASAGKRRTAGGRRGVHLPIHQRTSGGSHPRTTAGSSAPSQTGCLIPFAMTVGYPSTGASAVPRRQWPARSGYGPIARTTFCTAADSLLVRRLAGYSARAERAGDRGRSASPEAFDLIEARFAERAQLCLEREVAILV